MIMIVSLVNPNFPTNDSQGNPSFLCSHSHFRHHYLFLVLQVQEQQVRSKIQTYTPDDGHCVDLRCSNTSVPEMDGVMTLLRDAFSLQAPVLQPRSCAYIYPHRGRRVASCFVCVVYANVGVVGVVMVLRGRFH